MSSKLKRQNIIKEILSSRSVSSHEELVSILEEEDIQITQATLSRDFADMGVVRIFTENGPRYVLNPEESGRQIIKLVGLEIVNIQHNESLIVVRTLAGRAQGVAHYIDRLNRKEIIGTVAGDDTVLIIPNSHDNIKHIINYIENIMNDHQSKFK